MEFDHEDIRRRRDGGMSLKKIAAEVGCSKALVGLVVKDMPLKCLRCHQAPIPSGRGHSKCDDCKVAVEQEAVKRRNQRRKPRPRRASGLPGRIKAMLLGRPDLSMPKIAAGLGCSRIYVAKVAKREGIRHSKTGRQLKLHLGYF
jgi:biotin operon repressor